MRGFYRDLLVWGTWPVVYDRGMQQTPLAFGVFVGVLYIIREIITAVWAICWRAAGQCTDFAHSVHSSDCRDDRRVGHSGIFGIAIAFDKWVHGRAASYRLIETHACA
ncbi:MAG: hypothetical protein ACLVJ6_17770 [Merdibacter sp.]